MRKPKRASRTSPDSSSAGLRQCLTLILLTSLVASATEGKPKAKTKVFDDVTNVVQVEVPVNVTTRNGEPIRGLTAEDFEVFDLGKRRELVGFEVIDLAALDAAAAEDRIAELPAVARRHFLLLFDFSFSSPTSILKARQAAQSFVLEGMHPTDLVAIASFSLEYGPKLVLTFTPDRAQLARAIDGLRMNRDGASEDPLRFFVDAPRGLTDQGTGAGESNGERSEIREALEESGFESFRAIGNQMQRGARAFERSRITSWSRSMGELAKMLNSVAGRKHVVMFSDGFDSELLLGRAPTVEGNETELQDRIAGRLWLVDGDETYGNVPLQNDIESMLEEFRRADAVIQAVDSSGIQADFDTSIGAAGAKGGDALFFMANETGGHLFEDANDLVGQLRRVLERSTVTYILSFQPQGLALDGRYHRLKVKLKDKRRTKLSHRSGYYAPRPYGGLHPLEKSLLASDAIASAEPSQDVLIDVLAVPFRSTAEMAYVPVIIEVEGETLLALQEEDDLIVEIYAYITDEVGEMRDFFAQLVSFDLRANRDRLKTSGIKYYGHLEIEPGKYLLRVLVRNGTTGRTGVEVVPIEVPPYEAAELQVLPPFFHDSPGRWVLLKERVDEAQSKSVIYPFTVGGEPFVPAAKAALRRNESADLCLVAYNLSAESLDLRSWVIGGDGVAVRDNAFDSVERTVTGISGLDKLRARFDSRNLAVGEYTLRVGMTDPDTGIEQMSSIPFVIEN